MARKPDKTRRESVSADLSPEKAHAALSKQLEALQALKGRNYLEAKPAEDEWDHLTEKLIIRIFGSDSSNLRSFHSAHRAGMHQIPYPGSVDHRLRQSNYELRIQGFEAVLKSCLYELELDLRENENGAQQVSTKESQDWRLARLAIDEARKSVPENDGRPHPLVGAVVAKNGEVLATAHRSEAEGNHAEYVALEKKLAHVPVAGATVYTTLEPCTTRSHPKIPCADRLVERKVRRVVIGMLDPDPRISGRGQRRLRSANIITDFFPHDLMTEVEELNREFARKFGSASGITGSPSEPSPPVIDKQPPSSVLRHRNIILTKLEDPKDFGLVRVYCWPREKVAIPFSDLSKFLEHYRFEFSEKMRHFRNIDVSQDGISIGYFPRLVRQDARSTMRISLYVDGLAAFDALADASLDGDRQLHAGWLCYEVQRQLQLAKALLSGQNAIHIQLTLDLEHMEVFRLAIPMGSWAQYVPYAGGHEPLTREVTLEEIYDFDADRRNIVMPTVRDIMDEVGRIFGLSQAPSGLWDDHGYLLYVKGLESQR